MKINNKTNKKLYIELLSKTQTEEPDNLNIELKPDEQIETNFPTDYMNISLKKMPNSLLVIHKLVIHKNLKLLK